VKQLAKIKKATLNIRERAILGFTILVDYEDGVSQGVGGLALDEWCEEKKSRVGTAYGCEMIRRILLTLDVDDFSEMAGMYIWVLGEGSGFSFKPSGISRLAVDGGDSEPLVFGDVYDEFKGV